jgi:osmotically-inducible protein OsmY
MAERERILRDVRAALESEPRVDLHRHPLALDFADGDLILEGEVADVAAKKLALERAAAVSGVSTIVDRLRVIPAEAMADDALRQAVVKAFLQEPAFAELALHEETNGRLDVVRASPVDIGGVIVIAVADGVVTLNGWVRGLDEKRLAGVLAWWVPGSRDVVNGLAVEPPETDSDDAIAEAVRIVLEKDPFVDASQIRVGVRRAQVLLQGLVPKPAERSMAEQDAWYVFGVDKVTNEIRVRA